MIERKLKPNGKCGSKLITLPKTIIALAGLDGVETVKVDVKNGEIIIKK